MHFPPPTTRYPIGESIDPRPLLPIQPPPEPLDLPPLPSPPRQASFSSAYTLTTHLIPAAYPRTTRDVPLPPLATQDETKQERRSRAERTLEEILERKAHQPRLDSDPSKRILWNAVNRYVRKDSEHSSGKSLTLLFTHANGFPKEIWEPTIAYMISMSGIPVDEIWSFEAIQHGDAALVNAENTSGLFDWADQSRDILNFLINFLPTSLSFSTLPVHLPRLSENVSESRKADGFAVRNLVVVGHSFGGCTSTLAAVTYPALFSSLILVDPIISRYFILRSEHIRKLTLGAILRREHWPSREEARRLFRESPFFGAWDPAVLDVYIECGMYDDPKGGVRLKMSGIQEAVVFAEGRVGREVWELLETLDNNIELRWIVAGKGQIMAGPVEDAPQTVWRRPTNCSNVQITSSGHLIAQEAPKELAREINEFLQKKYGTERTKL